MKKAHKITETIHEPIERNKNLPKLENKLLIATCIILGIAIIWFGGYGYYLFSRLAIFIIMIILFVKNYKHKVEWKLWLYGITAFMYNPLISIHLTRPFRTIIDIGLLIRFIQIIRKNQSIGK